VLVALLNLLLLPILAALGLFTADGGGAPGDAGAGGNAGTAGGQAGGNTSGGGQGTGQGGATASGKTDAGGQAPPAQQGTALEDVARLQAELNTARAEAGRYRAAGIQAIADALGIKLPKGEGEEGQEAAITTLQREINDLRTEARANAINAAFERVVGQLGAKPVLTRRYVDGQLADLDPKAADFTQKLEQIVQAAINEEPALKATQAAARSGGEFSGGAKPPDPQVEPGLARLSHAYANSNSPSS
jgi:hypothetical protein